MSLLQKLVFKNKVVGGTPVNAQNLNKVQDYTEQAINQLDLNIDTNTGNKVTLAIDSDYLMTLKLINAKGIAISTATIDFPIESMVVNAKYENGIITLTLQNGQTLQVNISDIVKGLVNQSTFDTAVKQINQKISDLTSKHTNDITAINKEQEIQNKELERIKSNLINLSAEGEEIQVNDSSDLSAKIDVRGNTKQETTEGYNLIEIANNSQLNTNTYDVEIRDNIVDMKIKKATESISFQLNNKLFKSVYGDHPDQGAQSFLLKAGTYTLQYIHISGSSPKDKLHVYKRVSLSKGQNIVEIPTGDKDTQITFTLSEDTNVYISTYLYLSSEYSADVKFKIQLVKGTEPKPYEPYTGGQASPNPEFPQEIESVKAYNLLNVPSKLQFKNESFKKIPIKLEAGKTYTLQVDDIIDENNPDTYLIGLSENSDNIDFIFDFNKGNKKIILNKILKNYTAIYVYADKTAVESKKRVMTFVNMQVHEGAEDKPYSPYGEIAVKQTNEDGTKEKLYPLHLGNIELNKIGDSQDYFHKVGSKWYLHSIFNKIIINGTENIAYDAEKNYARIPDYNFKGKNPLEKGQQLSNYFLITTDWGTTFRDSNKNLMNTISNQGYKICFRNNVLKSVEEYKQWLRNNPTEIVYQLETPTETEITDPILIEQLDNLEKAEMFKPTTILTNNSIADMKLDYIADTKTYIDNKFATLSKAIVTSEGGN